MTGFFTVLLAMYHVVQTFWLLIVIKNLCEDSVKTIEFMMIITDSLHAFDD